jgi:hypothetical protein
MEIAEEPSLEPVHWKHDSLARLGGDNHKQIVYTLVTSPQKPGEKDFFSLAVIINYSIYNDHHGKVLQARFSRKFKAPVNPAPTIELLFELMKRVYVLFEIEFYKRLSGTNLNHEGLTPPALSDYQKILSTCIHDFGEGRRGTYEK